MGFQAIQNSDQLTREPEIFLRIALIGLPQSLQRQFRDIFSKTTKTSIDEGHNGMVFRQTREFGPVDWASQQGSYALRATRTGLNGAAGQQQVKFVAHAQKLRSPPNCTHRLCRCDLWHKNPNCSRAL